jgi:hypothetical protein
MKRTQPNRAELPARPRPGLEVVFKKISHIPRGGIICTVSYLESTKREIAPVKKQTLFVRFAGALGRLRLAMETRLNGLRGKIGVWIGAKNGV